VTDRDGLMVNSFHHQAADRIGAGLAAQRSSLTTSVSSIARIVTSPRVPA
jgi:gamma-glutamyl-gamma-aminobutyrate hydrolase PuuD